METGLEEWKFWIQISCIPGEEWALLGYSCQRHTTWITPLISGYKSNKVEKTTILISYLKKLSLVNIYTSILKIIYMSPFLRKLLDLAGQTCVCLHLNLILIGCRGVYTIW